MRARALFGGFAILAAVALMHRPSSQPGAARAESLPGCSASAPGTFCDAITRLGKALHDPALPFHRTNILPPPETPGAIDPGVTQANIDTTICRSGYARSVRPAYAVTGPLKRRLMDVEYPGQSMADYELDHLIPISLGGAPFDRRDLWLQPRGGQANAGEECPRLCALAAGLRASPPPRHRADCDPGRLDARLSAVRDAREHREISLSARGP